MSITENIKTLELAVSAYFAAMKESKIKKSTEKFLASYFEQRSSFRII